MSQLVTAITTSQVKNIGLIAIVAVVLIGILIARLVTKIITRLILLIVVAVLVFVVYNQRHRVTDAANKARAQCDVTFFGVHVTPSDPTVKKACVAVTNN